MSKLVRKDFVWRPAIGRSRPLMPIRARAIPARIPAANLQPPQHFIPVASALPGAEAAQRRGRAALARWLAARG